MQEKYYIRVHIESAGTSYQDEDNNITKSLAGHMWFQTYTKDENGVISNSLDSGYTMDGIVDTDAKAYLGNSTYSTRERELTKEQYKQLQEFGEQDSKFAEKLGFGNDDYNLLTNSCIDYTWKALELAEINKSKFEGDLIPMHNRNELNELLNNAKLGYFIDSFINLEYTNKIETENFYKLPKDTQSQLANEGKHPTGPKWNSFINEMLHYHLNNETRGINDLENLSYKLIEEVEENKEEKINSIEKKFENINSQMTIEQRVQSLKEYEVASTLDNYFAKQLIEQYQDKVIENQGQKVSSQDFMTMDIKERPKIEETKNEENTNKEKEYISFSSTVSLNQNNNSSIQMQ